MASVHKSNFSSVTAPVVKFAGKYQNTLILLRFHFSLFLLPVTLFSFYFSNTEAGMDAVLILFIWHFLVFPSSNGYNSWHDRDTGPIGGLSAPPLPDRSLLFATNMMDFLAVTLSLLISLQFSLMVMGYILASRLYSNRKTRLKKHPVSGFMIVFLFQGFWVFMANILALYDGLFSANSLLAAFACSCFVGALYPITQIYQHDADRADGVVSFSMMLGKKKTVLFTALMFALASISLFRLFDSENQIENFILFNAMLLPATIYFFVWMIRAYRNEAEINFKNTMIMVILSSFMLNLYFLFLLFK